MKSNAVDSCRYWLQGKLYPNTTQSEFLSLLMGLYKLDAVDAYRALSEAEQAEQFADQSELGVDYGQS